MGRSEQTIKWYRQKMELYLDHEGGPAARVLKTRKPGPKDQVRIQATARRPLQKAVAERERFELSMGQ